MTEDDTFRILKRPPYQDMWELYLNFIGVGIKSDKSIEHFLKGHGWTREELSKAFEFSND